MAWYGWLILGILITVVAFLVIVILKREPLVIRGLTDEERQLLFKIEKDRDKKAAEFDALRVVRLEEIAKQQKSKISKLEMTYNASKSFISKQKQAEFEGYLSDADSVGRELDKLLGNS